MLTLQLLWDEYHATHGTRALRYSAYCERLSALGASACNARCGQRHYAGEKLFVDYAGSTVPIYGGDVRGGVPRRDLCRRPGGEWLRVCGGDAHCVAPDWLGSHVRMLTFLWSRADDFGAGQSPGRSDQGRPLRARTTALVRGNAAHYSIAVIPARPFRPKGQPKAELTVLLVLSLGVGTAAASTLLQPGGV